MQSSWTLGQCFLIWMKWNDRQSCLLWPELVGKRMEGCLRKDWQEEREWKKKLGTSRKCSGNKLGVGSVKGGNGKCEGNIDSWMSIPPTRRLVLRAPWKTSFPQYFWISFSFFLSLQLNIFSTNFKLNWFNIVIVELYDFYTHRKVAWNVSRTLSNVPRTLSNAPRTACLVVGWTSPGNLCWEYSERIVQENILRIICGFSGSILCPCQRWKKSKEKSLHHLIRLSIQAIVNMANRKSKSSSWKSVIWNDFWT